MAIWERRAYNLFKQGKTVEEIVRILNDGLTEEDVRYAIELCSHGPVPYYETEEDV